MFSGFLCSCVRGEGARDGGVGVWGVQKLKRLLNRTGTEPRNQPVLLSSASAYLLGNCTPIYIVSALFFSPRHVSNTKHCVCGPRASNAMDRYQIVLLTSMGQRIAAGGIHPPREQVSFRMKRLRPTTGPRSFSGENGSTTLRSFLRPGRRLVSYVRLFQGEREAETLCCCSGDASLLEQLRT